MAQKICHDEHKGPQQPRPSIDHKNQYYQRSPTFSDLGEDIFHLIATELYATSRSSLPALARVSPALDGVVTPYIYRNLILRSCAEDAPRQAAYENLIERLQGERGSSLAKHVRHLRVDDMTSATNLETIIDNCENLREFSWNVNALIPPSILKKLESLRSDFQLHVVSLERHSPESPAYTLDGALLSSPRLTSLDLTIFTNPQKSEYAPLFQALSVGGHCKSLRIHKKEPQNCDLRRIPAPSPRFLPASVQFPALEEFSIYVQSHHPLDLDLEREQYNFLRKCLQSRCLRRLDLHDVREPRLFDGLAGHHPHLSHLRIGLPYLCWSIPSVETYISALTDLRGLEISGLERFTKSLWPIVKQHKDTLEELVLRPVVAIRHYEYAQGPYYHGREYLDVALLEEIVSEFSALRSFGFDVPFDKEAPASKDETGIDERYMSLITKLNLKHLHLYLHLPRYPTLFAPIYTPFPGGDDDKADSDIDVEASRKAGAAIADRISASQKQPLKTLTLHFSKNRYDEKEAKVQLRRIERDDAESLEMGKYEVIERAQWRTAGLWEPWDLRVFEIGKEE